MDQAVASRPLSAIRISAITAGEVLYGQARRPERHRAAAMAAAFLGRVNVLPWDRSAAEAYGILRAQLERIGQPLAPLDLLISAHALSVGAVLVTNDQAMLRLPELEAEDWTRES